MAIKNSNDFIKMQRLKRPKHLMSEEEYRSGIKEFCSYPTFSPADDKYLKKLDSFTENAKCMIYFNTSELTCSGTKYYISNSGDDANDGLTPETAWATYENPNNVMLQSGDLVLFERGGIWRGMLKAQNGVSYSAYGVGPKPKLLSAYDGLADGKWLKTERENVWVFDKVFKDEDIPEIVFNCGEKYALKKLTFADLRQNLDFLYLSDWSNEIDNGTPADNRVYLYFDGKNPADAFCDIEINMCNRVITSDTASNNIRLHNLELLYGTSPFWTNRSYNIEMTYCVCGWSGGKLLGKEKNHVRYGGGICTWHSCNNITFDHCYIYQQFDSGVTPQYHYWKDEISSVFSNYTVQNCVFENIEYTLEYFNTQINKPDNRFDNMYFGYNLCRKGGHGFGDKTEKSRYIKSWGHENVCNNCTIEYNIFDRAASLSIEIIGHEPEKRGEHISYNHIPILRCNTYIEPKNKCFANINKILYDFNEASYIAIERLGVETGAVYMFTE